MLKRWTSIGILTAVVWASVATTVFAYSQQTLNFDPDSTIQNGTQLGGSEVNKYYGPEGGPVVIAAQIVNLLLGGLGLFCLAMFVYGGYIWLIARGNEEQVKKAKDILTGTVIGLLFILASYGIAQYVFRAAVSITN